MGGGQIDSSYNKYYYNSYNIRIDISLGLEVKGLI